MQTCHTRYISLSTRPGTINTSTTSDTTNRLMGAGASIPRKSRLHRLPRDLRRLIGSFLPDLRRSRTVAFWTRHPKWVEGGWKIERDVLWDPDRLSHFTDAMRLICEHGFKIGTDCRGRCAPPPVTCVIESAAKSRSARLLNFLLRKRFCRAHKFLEVLLNTQADYKFVVDFLDLYWEYDMTECPVTPLSHFEVEVLKFICGRDDRSPLIVFRKESFRYDCQVVAHCIARGHFKAHVVVDEAFSGVVESPPSSRCVGVLIQRMCTLVNFGALTHKDWDDSLDRIYSIYPRGSAILRLIDMNPCLYSRHRVGTAMPLLEQAC